MIKKAPQKSPTSPQSRRPRAPVRSAVSAISVSSQAPTAADTCANQPPAASPLPPNNSKSSRRRAAAVQTAPTLSAPTTPPAPTTSHTPTAPTHHGKPLYAGVADTARVADTAAHSAAIARGAQTTAPAVPAAPTSTTLSAFDLALWLKQRAQKADPLFWLAFAVAFVALNLIFLFHGAHFLFGDHDWKYLKPGLSLGAGLFEGRFAQFLPINILSGGDILPIINNILGFAGFSLGVALLARYWRLPRQKSAWLLFALFTAVTPYILSFMYFAFLIIPVLGWSAFVLSSLLISEKETRFSPIRSLSAIALATLALGGYPPVVNLMAVALAVRLLFAALFEGESARGLWRRYRWTAINLLSAAICCKLCLWGLGKIGAMNTAYYNLQTTPLAEWGNKFLLVSRDLWQQFTVTLPFIDTPYKTAAGLVAACGVASFTRLLIAPKSDCTPELSDHQTHPFCSPSQPDSSHLTNQPPSATPGACPARVTAPTLTKSDCTPDQPADHQTRPTYSPSQPDSSHPTNQPPSATPDACPAGQNISTPPELPLAPLKTFSQQTRLARVCPAGQPTPTAAAPLTPSSLPLNRTDTNHPSNKCGSSAFAPTGLFPRIRHKIKCLFSYPAPTTQTTRLKSETTISSLPLNRTDTNHPSNKCGSSAFAPSGQNLSATPPLPSASPELSDHQTHPAPYTTRTTTPANRISQTALLLLLFAAVLYAPLLTLFISTSLAETEFSPRIDFFGLMYFYAAMFALTLKAAAPAGLPLTSEPSPKKSDASQPADHQTHPFCSPSQSVSSSQSSSRQATPAVACPAGQPTPTAAAPLTPSSLPLNRTDTNHPSNKCGSSAFAPSGLFPHIRHKIKCLFAHPTPITNISQPTSRQIRLARICPKGQNLSAAPATPVSPISQALKNLATAAAIAAITVSAHNLFDAQKVWKLGFDAEMKLYRRAAARFMSSPDFFPSARYIMVQGGSPSFRPRFYHTPYEHGSDDLLDTSYVPGMNPAVMWNYYGVTEYGDPKSYVYTLRPTASDAEIIRRAVPWPSPKSAKVINADSSLQNWIMLIMTPNGHAAVKNTYGL